MTFFRSIAIIYDANVKWDISSSVLFLWNDFSLYWIDFRCVSKSTSICVEMTLYLKSSQTALHNVMHFGIDTTWQTHDVKERFGFIYNWSANQRNHSNSWELEQGKTFIKWILISKAEDVRGERFFGFPLFLNHGNDTVQETIVTVKS